MTQNELLDLLSEIEREDPIDFADLPYDEDHLRRLACINVAELMQSDAYGSLGRHDRDCVFAATIARLILENMVLHTRLLSAASSAVKP